RGLTGAADCAASGVPSETIAASAKNRTCVVIVESGLEERLIGSRAVWSARLGEASHASPGESEVRGELPSPCGSVPGPWQYCHGLRRIGRGTQPRFAHLAHLIGPPRRIRMLRSASVRSRVHR